MANSGLFCLRSYGPGGSPGGADSYNASVGTEEAKQDACDERNLGEALRSARGHAAAFGPRAVAWPQHSEGACGRKIKLDSNAEGLAPGLGYKDSPTQSRCPFSESPISTFLSGKYSLQRSVTFWATAGEQESSFGYQGLMRASMRIGSCRAR